MRKREDLTGFGARLRKLREDRNITQKDMIAKVNEYFDYKRFATVQAYNRYEIYDAQPDIDLLKCFSHILKVSADELICNDSPLQKALMLVRKNGIEVTDKGNGFVEMIEDDRDQRLEAIFSYDDFIDVVKNVEEEAQEEYISSFLYGFDTGYFLQVYAHIHPDMVTFTPKNKNAYNDRPEWIKFNSYKEEQQQKHEETVKYVHGLIERAEKGDPQAIKEYEEIFNRIDKLQEQYERMKKELEEKTNTHYDEFIKKQQQ